MTQETTDSFTLTVQVDYDVERFEGDPDDLYRVADLERESLYDDLEGYLEDLLPNGTSRNLSVKVTPKISR